MTTTTKSQYELFHEWLNDCPVKFYISDIDSSLIEFDIPEDSEVN